MGTNRSSRSKLKPRGKGVRRQTPRAMSGLGLERKELGLKTLTQRLQGEETAVAGACRKCGFAGHLAFQCRNTIKAQTIGGGGPAHTAIAAGAPAPVVDV